MAELRTDHVVGGTEEGTRRAVAGMHACDRACWSLVAELGLDDRLPHHTRVTGVLTSDGAPGPP